MSTTTLTVLVYDVAHDGRRRKLHGLLRQYGTAVQESAFEARLSRSERSRLLARVERLLDPTVDRFVLYAVPSTHEAQIASVGLRRPEVGARTFFIV